MSRLLPPTDDHPASMLRWVRTFDFALIPLGVVVALIMRAEDLGAWWLGFVVSAFGLSGVATIGSAIRKAEEHGPNDPATRPQRMRRALRLTALWLGSFAVVAVIVALLAGETGLAITFAILFPLGGGLGLWLTPRIVNRK
jgi:hypothetical protein